jgi:hypothetical protein
MNVGGPPPAPPEPELELEATLLVVDPALDVLDVAGAPPDPPAPVVVAGSSHVPLSPTQASKP